MPILPDGARDLWENGRERNLLDAGEGQGYATWHVLPAPEPWQEIVQRGLKEKRIGLP